MSRLPIYDKMTGVPGYYDMEEQDPEAFIQHIKSHIDLFDEDVQSKDKYCCNLELFCAYCREFDKDRAMETLDKLNNIQVEHKDRFIPMIIGSLYDGLGLYDMACDYARMNLENILNSTSDRCNVVEIICGYALLQSLKVTHDPYDPEIQEIFKEISELTTYHFYGSQVLIGIFRSLIPLSLVPKSAVHILYSMLFFYKYLERVRPHESITEKSNSIELLIADLLEASKDDT